MKKIMCEWTRVSISGYREGMLSESDCARFEAHVLQCEACALELKRDERLDGALASVSAVEPRPVSWPEVQARVAPQPARQVWKPVGAFAAVAAAVALAWFGFFGGGSNVTPNVATSTEIAAQLDRQDSADLIASHGLMSVTTAGGDPNRAVILLASQKAGTGKSL